MRKIKATSTNILNEGAKQGHCIMDSWVTYWTTPRTLLRERERERETGQEETNTK